MAGNELKISLSVIAAKDVFDFKRTFGTKQIDMANGGRGGYTQTIGTSEEEIAGLGDLTAFGYALFENLDDENFVEIGPDSGGSMVAMLKLLAGEMAVLPLKPGITIRAKADTAAVRLDVNVLER